MYIYSFSNKELHKNTMFGSNIVFFILYDHSIHDSKSRMVNGHCFVSLTMSVPVMETRKGYQQQIHYVPISIGYAMWTPEKSKLELTGLSRPIFLAIALYMHM